MADYERAFTLVQEKFNINCLNEFQRRAITEYLKGNVDVFVNLPTGFGKSLIYQALPIILDSIRNSPGHIVVVVSPLVSLMADQVLSLQRLGIPSISLSDLDDKEAHNVEIGKYSVVYGSPESWLKNDRWRKMLSNEVYRKKLCCIAVDEAHVIKQWGTSNTTDKAIFRECYSRLHELRSLATNVQLMALTATATTATRKVIMDVLLMDNPVIIYKSPNKSNIAYSVYYMPREGSMEDYFGWLAQELIDTRTKTQRTIIYCQTIRQCSLVYGTLKGMLKENIYVGETIDRTKVLIEMLHSCTPEANKKVILQKFGEVSSELRVLVATIAFGMGVDCKEVYRTIHFGPAKNIESYIQETGRAGRDGNQSICYIVYQGILLTHVDKDIKQYVHSKGCRRKLIISHFDRLQDLRCPEVKHNCCDNCAEECDCGEDDCGTLTAYPGNQDLKGKQPKDVKETESGKTKEVTELQKMEISRKLNRYHKSLVQDLAGKSPHGQLPLTDLQFMLGFSNQQISQVLDNCHKIFSQDDVMTYVEIWHIQHCVQIMNILTETLGGFSDTQSSVQSHMAFDDDDNGDGTSGWLGNWDILINDEELFELAIENLSMSLLDTSMNESHDNTIQDVPTAAMSALENLRLV